MLPQVNNRLQKCPTPYPNNPAYRQRRYAYLKSRRDRTHHSWKPVKTNQPVVRNWSFYKPSNVSMILFEARYPDKSIYPHGPALTLLLIGSTYYSVLPFYSLQLYTPLAQINHKNSQNSINYNRNTSSLWYKSSHKAYLWPSHPWLGLRRIQRSLALSATPIAIKVTFQGKGYYMYKSWRNTFSPQFGYYHRHYCWASSVGVKRRGKRSISLYGLCRDDLLSVGRTLYNWRPIKLFTGRGVRFSRQKVYRKPGKISAYR